MVVVNFSKDQLPGAINMPWDDLFFVEIPEAFEEAIRATDDGLADALICLPDHSLLAGALVALIYSRYGRLPTLMNSVGETYKPEVVNYHEVVVDLHRELLEQRPV